MPRTSKQRFNFHAVRQALVTGVLWLLAGCTTMGDVKQPIPTRTIDAPAATIHHTLVVVLPGRGDSLATLDRSGIASAIQAQWPDADVILTGTAMAYYMVGGVWQRLHDEVVEPARARGYTDIWVVGASLGGMGALLYEQHYPGELRGMLLLAPYLGERPLARDISAAGGLEQWQPGPVPEAIDADNFRPELWRWLQTWIGKAEPARRVWMGYGDNDKLRYAFPNFTPLLATDHVFVRPGRHAWAAWTPLVTEIFGRIRAEQLKEAR